MCDRVPWIALTMLCGEDTQTAWRIVRRINEMEIELAEFFNMTPGRRETQFQDEVFRLIFDRDLNSIIEHAELAAAFLDENDVAVRRPIDDDYPRRFLIVAHDAVPPVLYIAGDTDVFDEPAVGIVGSRRATGPGLEYAWSLARIAAERNIAVISGGAAGIDSAAHRGALDTDGKTVVVLPHGLAHGDVGRMMDQYPDNVSLVSQFPPRMKPCAGAALARNRTIAGMSGAVVTVESGVVSGTMSTARHARSMDVPLFAVKWDDHEPVHEGLAKLIANGARPLPPELTHETCLEPLFAAIE